jgi:predicted transcriptional regulator of viral defense system
MRYDELLHQINTPTFHTYQVAKLFPEENGVALRFQLSRLAQRNKILRLKRGLYLFKDRPVDEMVLAGLMYEPSYVSLEKALNIYGIIPDIPSSVTSITTTTSNDFSTPKGRFSFSCVKKTLFFGFTQKVDSRSQMSYQIAEPEKALLDWIYLRKIKTLEENRIDLSQLNQERLAEFSQHFPNWVTKTLE